MVGNGEYLGLLMEKVSFGGKCAAGGNAEG